MPAARKAGSILVAALALMGASTGCERPVALGSREIAVWPGGVAPCDPAAAEICNGVDDDCDGQVDEGQQGSGGICADPCRVVQLASRAILRADGTVLTWGLGPRRGAPDSDPWLAPRPLALPEPAVQITSGCARLMSGRAYCWLRLPTGTSGSLPPSPLEDAENTVAAIYQAPDTRGLTCVRRSGARAGTLWCWDDGDSFPGPWMVPGLPAPIRDASIGHGESPALCALLTTGQIWCSSSTSAGTVPVRFGNLGDDNIGLAASNRVCGLTAGGQVGCTDSQIAPSRRHFEWGLVRSLALRGDTSCVLRQEGSVACAGDGLAGQLGNGEFTERVAQPVEVTGLEGGVEELQPFCARKADSGVWCWGPAPVGDGTTLSRAAPVVIDACPERKR
jgi:hypothetical protein